MVVPRWLKLLILVGFVLGAGLAATPWWLGAALRPLARSQGVAFDHYERVGYSRFRLTGVHFNRPAVAVTAARVEADTPLLWLARRLQGDAPAVTVEDWRVALRNPAPAPPPGTPPTSPAIDGLPALGALTRQLAPRLVFWLPRLRLSNGEITGLGPPLPIAQADWSNPTLAVAGLQVAGRAVAFQVQPGAAGALALTARSAGNEFTLQLELRGVELRGRATVLEQPLELFARFPPAGWVPVEARVVATDWSLPAASVKLGALYAAVQGRGRADWQAGKFEISLDARATPKPDAKAPALEASARAHGTPAEITLTALHVDAPFATADLSAPVTFALDRPAFSGAAQLAVTVDLAKQPWFDATGRGEGRVTVSGSSAANARQEFDLAGSGFSLAGFAVKEARVRGTLQWPRLEVTDLLAELDDMSRVSAGGYLDLQTDTFSGVTLKAYLTPAWFLPWLPAGTTWQTAELEATVDGPFRSPVHSGSLAVTQAELAPLRPLALTASWSGRGASLESLTASADTGAATVTLGGALDPQGLQLTSLGFTSRGQPVWDLAAPARLSWSPAVRIENLRLTGPAQSLSLSAEIGPAGHFDLAATGLRSSWLQDWLELTGPAWSLENLTASGRDTDGVLVFAAKLGGQIDMTPRPAHLTLSVQGDAAGVRIEELQIVESGRLLTSVAGTLPVAWATRPAPGWRVDEAAKFSLVASTEPDSPLWAALAAATGVILAQPVAQVRLDGTLREPQGELQLRVARVKIGDRTDLPELTELDLAAQAGRNEIRLTRLSAKLDGQAVTGTGRVAMDDGRWLKLWREPATFDWQNAEATLAVPAAELAAFAHHAPSFLAAQGRLTAQLALAPGGNFSGEIHLTGAASRPLGTLGVLQDLNADLRLEGRKLVLQSVAAKLGGEPLALDGSVELDPQNALRFDLGLKGANLPLVRSGHLLVRADLDLRARTDGALTRLAGTVNLRDCLVLANLGSLLPTGPRGLTRQPPYFAVAAAPFHDWQLDVTLHGDRAIRIRTTVFAGAASARFHLDGTLGEPRAVGEILVDEGAVLFPFATFAVQFGALRLRASDPHRAVLDLAATAQRHSYQLRLEAAGELPAPDITVTSSPALDAEAVLLLVMTGQSPAESNAATAGQPRLAGLGAYFGQGLAQQLGFGGQRLEISTGERISEQGRETYDVEYRLNDRWSLQGGYDHFDNYNAGVKWRIYTEEGAPHDKK